MRSKKKSKSKSKLSSTEIRTPINLQQLANKQKFSVAKRENNGNSIPYIKSRGFTPGTSSQYSENSIKPIQSLQNFLSISEHNSKGKIPLRIEVDSFDDKSEESNRKAYQEYQNDLNKIKQDYEEKISHQTTGKTVSDRYKAKYKKKFQDLLVKQSERHKGQIDLLTKNYEGKIAKYREIIEKLQEENEELVTGKKVKRFELISPLIEENLWLKQQLKSMGK